jgi:hypothetical protein
MDESHQLESMDNITVSECFKFVWLASTSHKKD